MKKRYKIMLVFLIILSIYLTIQTVYAIDIWGTADKFIGIGTTGDDIIDLDESDLKNSIFQIVDFLWGIGLVVIIISTMVLGIRYMLVLPNERSRIKQATTPYIIGVVIIFGALTIWRLVIQILEGSLWG